jgi:hypothetical protein
MSPISAPVVCFFAAATGDGRDDAIVINDDKVVVRTST